MNERATTDRDDLDDDWTRLNRGLDEAIAAYLDELPARDRPAADRVLLGIHVLLGELDARVVELERGRMP